MEKSDYWKDALTHLKAVDATMATILAEDITLLPREKRTAFQALARSIVGQQISTSAATSVWNKFETVCGSVVTPEAVRVSTDDDLRSAGLSGQKVTYVRALADWFHAQGITDAYFTERSYTEVHTALVALPGIGHWTIQMFAMFHLQMPDIWPTGDLGIQRALEKLYPEIQKKSTRLKGKKKEKMFMKAGEHFAPYRSVAAQYLWKSLDNEPLVTKAVPKKQTKKIKKT